MYTCIFMYFLQQCINTYKFKSTVEVYPIDVNTIEAYPTEAYLIGKGVGRHQRSITKTHVARERTLVGLFRELVSLHQSMRFTNWTYNDWT